MNISKLLKKYNLTRSPYIFYDGETPSMYFTVYQNGKWHLYFTNNKEVQKVDFLQGYSIKQVTCFKKQDLYCVSFCGEFGGNDSLFYTETTNPTQFKIITSIAHNVRAGVVTSNKVIFFNQQNQLLIYQKKEDIIIQNQTPIKKLLFSFNNPTHISFLNDNQQQFIVGYRDIKYPDRHGSIYVNLNNIEDQKQILTKDNQPLYDVTIDNKTKQILYSKRIGLKEFQRKIAKTFVKNIISNQVSMLK